MNFSKDKYTLTSPLSVTEVTDRLYQNTLFRKKLMRTRTDKLFIGEVTEDDFYIMGSSRTGVLCVVNGKVSNDGQKTIVEIETRLHRAFLILFSCWAILVIAGAVVGYLTTPKEDAAASPAGMFPILLLLIAGCGYLLHYVYTRSRNVIINQIEDLIA